MKGRIPTRVIHLAVALVAALALGAMTAGAAGAETVYNNIPAKPIGNYLSVSFEATLTSEFGGEVELAGTARSKPTVTVMMSSWACQSGSVNEQNCSTPKPQKTFKVPLTVRVYSPSEIGEGPLVTVTKAVKMSYRPSASPGCPEGRWRDEADAACYNGYSFPVSVKLSKLKKMPKKAIISVAYAASTPPSSLLNVAVADASGEAAPLIGAQPVEEWFVDSTSAEMYCPGAKDVGTFGPEEGTGCQGVNYQPLFSVNAN
jgi:hypothetical protein